MVRGVHGRTLVLIALAVWVGGCGDSGSDGADSSTTSLESVRQPPAPMSPPTEAPLDLEAVGRSAEKAVRSYYRALDRRDFAAAWQQLSPPLQQRFGRFEAWRAGFAKTISQTPTQLASDAVDADHASVTIRLRSRDRGACGAATIQRFKGSWSLMRTNGRWRARTVSATREPGQQPASNTTTCGSNERDAAATSSSGTERVCYPGVTIPAVTIPAVTIPGLTVPATDIGGRHYPARRYPARHYPAHSYPARHYAGRCFDAPSAFAPSRTTLLRDTAYPRLDPSYSPELSRRHLASTGSRRSYPDPTAPGFGESNAAGFPKNQYVRPYVRRDGTAVSGYWRNSPSDGLPTCKVIDC